MMQAETAVKYAVLSGCCCLLPADMEKVEIHQSHSCVHVYVCTAMQFIYGVRFFAIC